MEKKKRVGRTAGRGRWTADDAANFWWKAHLRAFARFYAQEDSTGKAV